MEKSPVVAKCSNISYSRNFFKKKGINSTNFDFVNFVIKAVKIWLDFFYMYGYVLLQKLLPVKYTSLVIIFLSKK